MLYMLINHAGYWKNTSKIRNSFYGNWRRHATYQQIVVYTEDLFISVNYHMSHDRSVKSRLLVK